MSRKKRTYQSNKRAIQAEQTRSRILHEAKCLFKSQGFDSVTIDKIAEKAAISPSSIYTLFRSKRGILGALMDEAMPPSNFSKLVEEAYNERDSVNKLKISAKIARQMYDAEKALTEIFRGASILAPELKKLELEREKRRYQRQEKTIRQISQEGFLSEEMSEKMARDILWMFTGRDIYRMMVIERKWSSDEYERWLAEQLIRALRNP